MIDNPFAQYETTNAASLIQQIPPAVKRIFEVGCGVGRLGEMVKARRPEILYHALESNPTAAKEAAGRLDHVTCANIETPGFDLHGEKFDCILFNGTLGQFYNPQAVLEKVISWLKPDGRILCSMPNLQHHSIIQSLLSGEFQHQNLGVLNKNHIRFFTHAGAIKLMLDVGFIPRDVAVIGLPASLEFCKSLGPSILHLKHHLILKLRDMSILYYIMEARPNTAYSLVLPRAFPISFIVPTNNERMIRDNLLSSPVFQGDHPHQLIILENKKSAAEAMEEGIRQATHKFVVYLHHDVYLPTRWDDIFCSKVLQAEAQFGNVGVFGVYGINCRDGKAVHSGFVLDRTADLCHGGPFPVQVESLDEVLLGFRRDEFPGTDPNLGYHMYATDIVCAYRERGQSAVVLDAICLHNSPHSNEEAPGFAASTEYFSKSKWKKYFPLITATGATFLPD